MKKTLLIASALISSFIAVADAKADLKGAYLGVRIGATEHDYSTTNKTFTDKLDTYVFARSLAAGYKLGRYRTELEFAWRDKRIHEITSKNLTTKFGFKSRSYMWNHYIDFMPAARLTPYVGVGIGFSELQYGHHIIYPDGHTENQISERNSKPLRFTWSAGVGLALKVSDKVSVDAGYRYYDMGSVYRIEVKADEYYCGLRYAF